MFGSEILEVAIGLSFIFFFASLMCSALREGIEAFLKTRAQNLEGWLRENLTDQTKDDGKIGSEGIIRGGDGNARVTLAGFYEHSLIYPLFSGTYDKATGKVSNLPSYVPSKHFAGALLDLLAPADGKGRPGLDQIATAAGNLQNERLKNVVLRAVGEANGDLDKARAAIEGWYDQSMERLSGYYKRWTQFILFCIGLIVAYTLNIDAIAVADQMLKDKALRQVVVAEASRVSSDKPENFTDHLDELDARIRQTGISIGGARTKPATDGGARDVAKGQDKSVAAERLPAGETKTAGDKKDAVSINTNSAQPIAKDKSADRSANAARSPCLVLVGWLVTALAVMLGAPFWFDVLNKLVSLRSAKKPEKAEKKSANATP